MILVDKALESRHEKGEPIRVALVGAGFIGKGIAFQIERYVKGMELVAICNRTISKAGDAYRHAGIHEIKTVASVAQLEESIQRGQRAITDNPDLVTGANAIDAIIEATSDIEFSAQIAIKAIEGKKNLVLMNADCDATVGPIIKIYADRAGVSVSATDGDQPGSMMNLYRFVKAIGYRPVLIGNMKGLQDFYRTPDTQRSFAAMHGLSAKMATSFADGTKISMENTLVANATGFRVGKRGMFGPRCEHVDDAKNVFDLERLLQGGIVDYVLGARPGPGVFVLGYDETPQRIPYMRYYKLGDGPLYVFYTPYHLASLEAPLTVARGVLFKDAAVAPMGGPVCDVITVAKRDLKKGEVLDGIGGFTCYGMIENADARKVENLLLMGLSEGCRLRRDITKDQTITNSDVEKPENRLIDRLRSEQDAYFEGAE
jgi:predicted homoserine dehydrogenase-like protein